MSDSPAWAGDAFQHKADRRLAVAFVAAALLHAAVILAVDVPLQDSGFSAPAIDFTLALEPAPSHAANVNQEAMADSSAVAPPPVTPAAEPANRLHDTTSVNDAPMTDPGPTTGIRTRAKPASRAMPYNDLAREIANAYARSERQQAPLGGGSRTKRLSSNSAKSAIEAAYLDMWRQQIERIGRANYPPGRISGELLLLAVIRQDGALQAVKILESSGHPALDEAALRIVRLAAPYSHFPEEMRKSYEQLEIVRRWRFAYEDSFF